MKNQYLILLFTLFLFSCGGPVISYRLATNTDPFFSLDKSMTYNIRLSGNEDNTVLEKKLLKMVDDKMLSNGWKKSTTNPDMHISVEFSLSDPIKTTKTGSRPVTTSHKNADGETVKTTTQQHYSKTYTTYEREIQISLHSKSEELIWKGEIVSEGKTPDILFMSPTIPCVVNKIGSPDISDKYRHNFSKSECPDD